MQNHTESVEAQEDFNITRAKVQKHLKKVAKWKTREPDLVHGYWLREFTKFHESIAMQLDECMTTGKVPSWMTKGRTCLILKEKSKGNIVSNYRPITCLPLMWKLLTGIIAEGTDNF